MHNADDARDQRYAPANAKRGGRRALLQIGLAAAAASGVALLASPKPALAASLTIDGSTATNSGDGTTFLESSGEADFPTYRSAALVVRNRDDSTLGRAAIRGLLEVASTQTVGNVSGAVTGIHGGNGLDSGVLGYAHGGTGTGVQGRSTDGTGVLATSTNGTALRVSGTSEFTQEATFYSPVTAESFIGDGTGLTSLSASQLSSGTLPDQRLSANVPRKSNTVNKFTGRVLSRQFAGVKGAPAFPTVGTVVVPRGQQQIQVMVKVASMRSTILTTLQGDPGDDVYVSHVERGKGRFTVVFNRPVRRRTKVGYFVVRS